MKLFRKLIFIVVFLALAGMMVYSGSAIVKVLSERNQSAAANELLQDQAVTVLEQEEPKIIINYKNDSYLQEGATGETEATEHTEEAIPIRVNFEYLRSINEDVAGWIYCEDTPISYPFVASADNNDYLYRLLDGTQNPSGSLFLDYRNQADLSDWNSVIYGHNMQDGTMFACLNEYKKQEYYDAHPTMYLLTPEKQYIVELVAGNLARADAYFYDFPVQEENRSRVVSEWLNASTFATDYYFSPDDRFVTLSTCSYEFDNARYVVIGVLREMVQE